MLGAAKSGRAAEMERVAAEGDGASSSIDGSSGGMTGATAQAKETAAAKCKNNNDKKSTAYKIGECEGPFNGG